MTITYDPDHPQYRDEADVRRELMRVQQICDGCRRCVDLCESFPTLFALMDRLGGNAAERDAGRLTPAEQDAVLDACVHCGLCVLECPFAPGVDPAQVDVPRLMLRAAAMRYATGQTRRPPRARRRMGRRDVIARLRTASVPATRLRPAIAGRRRGRRRQRFSRWFAERPRAVGDGRLAKVTLFAGCVVEFERPQIGRGVVQIYARNGIECTLSETGCCGYPSLLAGDVDHFRKVAGRNVATLAAELRRGGAVVVADPTCGAVLRREYGRYAPGADAELVAAATFDVAEYLVDACGREALSVAGPPSEIVYHAACHLQVQAIGLPARRLLEGAGSAVRVVGRCCRVADPGAGLDEATVVSDCCLVDGGILHPLAPLDAPGD